MVEGVSSEDSEVVDLYAICARASASPVGDLRPPDLLAAPAYTTDIGAGDDGEVTLGGMLKKPRIRLALGGVAGALLLIGVVIGLGSSKAPASRKAVTASITQAAPPPPPETVEAPPPSLAAASMKLPPPPTTGAPASPPAPPRAVAMRKPAAAPAAPAGPKMTKIRSDGTAVR